MAMPAWANDLWAAVGPYAERLAVWQGYESELRTLAISGIAIAVYTALVFGFYQALSKRKPIHFSASEADDWGGRWSRFFERAAVFPVLSFLYFAVLAIALFFLAKTQTTETILLIAMAVVVGVRVTVYISEAMSNDLAKLVPLSLLAVMLVDPGYLTLSTAWTRMGEAAQVWPLLGRYFLLFIVLEAVLSSARWTVIKAQGRRIGAPDKVHHLDVKESKPPIRKAP